MQKRIATLNTRERGLLLIFAVTVIGLFFIANRGAYRSFFTDDDLDNIANVRAVDLAYLARTFVKPLIAPDAVFRPVPDLYYYVLARTAGLRFTPYVAAIQLLHLMNVFLVWLLARTLGASRTGACAGAALFAFHAAMMWIYWRPMYVFDLLCATFALLTLLAYLRGPLILSLILFWVALKSKEVVVFLPLVMIAHEWFFEKRRWKRVAPFLAVSALFGIWALAYNSGRNNAYSLHFSASAIATCAQFYASKLVSGPSWVGLAALGAVFVAFARNRLVSLGLLTFISLMLVLLVLPGRIAGAYLYTAFIGLAIVISALTRPVWLAAFFAFWIPWNYQRLRADRKEELSYADERRAWFTPVADFVRKHPGVDTFIYREHPLTLADYGVAGALKSLHPADMPLTIVDSESPERFAAFAKPQFVVLGWNPFSRQLNIVPKGPDRSYVQLDYAAPLWQLGPGWSGLDYGFRWIARHAQARLHRPADARMFQVVASFPEAYKQYNPEGRLDIKINHQFVGELVFRDPNPQPLQIALAGRDSGPVEIDFDVDSSKGEDPRGQRALPIVAFGFK